MKFLLARVKLPTLRNSLLAILSAILLTLAFPDFDWWFLAWFALVPLFYAVESEKESAIKSFVLGWIFGTLFFCGACWWLTFSFITYGGIPMPIAYFLLFIICSIVGFFPAIFAAGFSIVLKRFGTYGILLAPVLWTATEFLRFNLTGNNWNAIGYSQAFSSWLLQLASIGGVYLVGFICVSFNSIYVHVLITKSKLGSWLALLPLITIALFSVQDLYSNQTSIANQSDADSAVVIIQANVPMSGLNEEKWLRLRGRHVELAENALQKLREQRTTNSRQPTTIIFPESPMNFMYERDEEFQRFINDFARRNNAYVLLNSAEPNPRTIIFIIRR
jgi:apolipoprotein N-acyltransferase